MKHVGSQGLSTPGIMILFFPAWWLVQALVGGGRVRETYTHIQTLLSGSFVILQLSLSFGFLTGKQNVWWKWKSLSRVWLFATPWTIQFMKFSRLEDTGVGSLSLLRGIFPTQRSNLGLLHCRYIRYQLSHQGSPDILVALYETAARQAGTGGVEFWQYGGGCWSRGTRLRKC